MIFQSGDTVYRPRVDGTEYWVDKILILECKELTKDCVSYLAETASYSVDIINGDYLYPWRHRALREAKETALANALDALVHERQE